MCIKKAFVPHPPPYKEGEGLAYSLQLAERTQGLSLFLTLLGWFLVVTGALLAIAGSVLGSSVGGSDEIMVKILSQRGLICSTFAIVSAGAGWQVLDRASAATRVASIATSSIMLASTINTTDKDKNICDQRAYAACIEAKTAWLEGRMNVERLETIVRTLQAKNGAPKESDEH